MLNLTANLTAAQSALRLAQDVCGVEDSEANRILLSRAIRVEIKARRAIEADKRGMSLAEYEAYNW